MTGTNFYEQVLSKIRYATADEKESIRIELQNHVEDHIETLKDAGYSKEECMERAILAMGDPEEIGEELSKQYPLRWLLLSRAALLLCFLMGFSLLLTLPFLSNVFNNLEARIAPDNSSFGSPWSYAAFKTYPLDIKVSIGSDIVSIYKASLHGDRETGYLTSIAMCNYDRNPFGITSSNLLNSLAVETVEGRQEIWDGGGGGGSAGAYYWTIRSIPVTKADKEVYLVYHQFGDEIRIAVPIPWEVIE